MIASAGWQGQNGVRITRILTYPDWIPNQMLDGKSNSIIGQ